MKEATLTLLQDLTNELATDLFWLKARNKNVLVAAFVSTRCRHKIQNLIKEITENESIFLKEKRIDKGLRAILNSIDKNEETNSLADKLINFTLQYERIERCIEEEKPYFWGRVQIYRRIPLNRDPSFEHLKF